MNDETLQYEVVEIRPTETIKRAFHTLGNEYWLFVGICFVGILLAGCLVPAILVGPIYCGIYLCWLDQLRGERVQFETLFRGFDVFVESLVATLLMIAFSCVPIVLGIICVGLSTVAGAAMGDAVGAAFIVMAIAILVILLLSVQLLVGVLCGFAYPLIIDRRMQALPALKASFAAAKDNFSGLLLLNVVLLVLGFLGGLMCCVPAILLMPIHFMALALVYEDVFPRADELGEPR